MDIFANFGLAWISVFIALFLAVAYLTRKAIVKFPKYRAFFIKFNKALRKYHKWIGVVLIATGLVHGLFSSDKLFSINWGTANWIFSILLGISWMLKKKLTGKKNWMYFHRILVVVFSISLVIHVIDVGGIQVFNVLKASKNIQTYENHTLYTKETGSETPSSVSYSLTPTPNESIGQITTSPIIEIPEGNIYKDGTFTGVATGYRPGLTISITIKNNILTIVEIVDHNEVSSRFWTAPVTYFPIWIVESQDTEIDTITGATFTSVGIINAANDALRQALVSGEISDDIALPTKRRR